MRRMASAFAIVLACTLTVSVSASSFDRPDVLLQWSPAVERVLEQYGEDARTVTIVPPADEDDDWTVIFTYADDSAPQWI